jgi:hypothetical protein
MGQAAREYIERCHSMEVRARQIEDLLSGQETGAHVNCLSDPRAFQFNAAAALLELKIAAQDGDAVVRETAEAIATTEEKEEKT